MKCEACEVFQPNKPKQGHKGKDQDLWQGSWLFCPHRICLKLEVSWKWTKGELYYITIPIPIILPKRSIGELYLYQCPRRNGWTWLRLESGSVSISEHMWVLLPQLLGVQIRKDLRRTTDSQRLQSSILPETLPETIRAISMWRRCLCAGKSKQLWLTDKKYLPMLLTCDLFTSSC